MRKKSIKIHCRMFDRSLPLEIRMGGDPEFEAIDKFSSRVKNGNTYFSGYGEIGCDCGNGYEVELRPKPKTEVLDFLNEFRRLVLKATKKTHLSSKGDTYPLGGHLHFGVYQGEANKSIDIEAASQLLDDFIGFTTDWSGMARGSYKRRNAFDVKSYGFEYRTPPSKIFEHPKILEVILKLSKSLLETGIRDGVTYHVDSNGIASKDDYLRFISEDELKTLMDWPKIRPGHRVSLNWLTGADLPPSIYLEFKDDWNSKVKETIEVLFESIKPKTHLSITLFGIAKSKGEVVSGFTSSMFSTIEIERYKEKGCFGIPLMVRENNSALCVRVLNILYNEITNKLKEDNLI